MQLSIRTFEAADYDAALVLWRETPGVGLSDADERAAIETFLARNPGTSFVALQGSALVGTVLCGHDGRRGLVHHLVVAEDCRRRGIARQLLAHSLTALRAAGIGKCHLFVFRSNTEGLAFWRGVRAAERGELAVFSLLTDEGH